MSTSSRILVVEDDFLLSIDLAQKLTEMGCEVAGTAHSGGEAVNLAKELKPDLALMDIRLGSEFDGISAAERIKAECRIPIIFLSGYSDESTLKRAAQSGAFGHLSKPVRTEELKTTIRLALEQSRAWRDLLSRNSWLATMLSSIEEGVVAIDQAGNVTYLNSQAEYMTGWTLPEVSGQPVENVYAPGRRDGTPLSESQLRLAVTKGTAVIRERLTLRTRTGREIPVEETVMAIWNEGRIDGALAVFRDLTDILKVQEADKLQTIGTLAGGVAHDFNNLLAVIVGNASLVRERLPEDARDRMFLDEVVKAGSKAAELTSQLLSYAGKSSSRKRPIDLSRLIRDTEALIRTVVPERIRIKIQTPEGLAPVEADASQLNQLLMNLVLNAAEAIDEAEGCIEISTGAMDADAVFLRVRDDGCGMDTMTRSRAFDPFFTTKFTGRGLGLAAVQGIVRTHGGSIDVHTEPRNGSTFTVVLPATSREPSRTISGRRGDASKTVLVVDDVEGVWRFVKTSLERAGFRVLIARDGNSAIEVVKSRDSEIDAVLLDLSMPGLSGVEAGRKIRKVAPSLPICYMSGYTEDFAVTQHADDELAGHFLQKPFTPRQLIAKLRYAMEAQAQSPSVH